MKPEPALVIFARAPIPGETKTRLIPALGPEGASELYRRFLLDTVANAASISADITIAAAEEDQFEMIRLLVSEICPQAKITVQNGSDLGQRMAHAFEQTLAAGHPCAAVIGSDSPSLPFERVRQALSLAHDRDLILGPCLDGGYYLIAMHALHPELFNYMTWGTDTVLIDTLRRAQSRELTVSLLDPWYDVDTPAELSVLRSHLFALSLAGHTIPCPQTWEYVRDLPLES